MKKKTLILQPSVLGHSFSEGRSNIMISSHVTLKTQCGLLKAEMNTTENGSFPVAAHKMSSALRRAIPPLPGIDCCRAGGVVGRYVAMSLPGRFRVLLDNQFTLL
jgi:hypothetical protein